MRYRVAVIQITDSGCPRVRILQGPLRSQEKVMAVLSAIFTAHMDHHDLDITKLPDWLLEQHGRTYICPHCRSIAFVNIGPMSEFEHAFIGTMAREKGLFIFHSNNKFAVQERIMFEFRDHLQEFHGVGEEELPDYPVLYSLVARDGRLRCPHCSATAIFWEG